jgi:hypothetical protein
MNCIWIHLCFPGVGVLGYDGEGGFLVYSFQLFFLCYFFYVYTNWMKGFFFLSRLMM